MTDDPPRRMIPTCLPDPAPAAIRHKCEDQMHIILRSLVVAMAVAVITPSAFAENGPASEMSVAEVIAALDANDLSANELRSLVSYERLDIVDLATLEDEADFEELEKALARVDDGWAMVQTAIVENDLIRQALRERSVSIQKVTAASSADGVVTIYVR